MSTPRQPHVRVNTILFLCAAVFLLAIFAGNAMLISFLKDQALAVGSQETRNLAYVLAEETDRGLQAADLVASDVVHSLASEGLKSLQDFEAASSGGEVKKYLREKLSGVPQIANVIIVLSNGKLINRTRGGPEANPELTDRDYLTSLKNRPDLSYHISSPFKSRTTGSWNTVLSRPIRSSTGEFLGVVAVVIELRTLEELYSKVALGRHGSIALFRTDGVLLARYPRIESLLGTSNSSSPLFTRFVANHLNGVLRQVSRIDSVDRIIAAHRTPNFPIVMTVSASVDDLLENWVDQKNGLLVGGLLAATAIVLSALMLARGTKTVARTTSELASAKEREAAQAEIEAEHNRFVAAIDNMGQGLVMFDADQNLIVCNLRYEELYKLPQSLTVPGTPRLAILKHREKMGTEKEGYSRLADIRSFTGENYTHKLGDGRMIEIVHRQMPEGGWVSTHEDVTARRQTEARVAHMAEHDSLTDLPNRMVFRRRLEEHLANLLYKRRFALLYVDLDRFKPVNDTLGHTTGDLLLQEVALRLRSLLSSNDFVARLGGDEFIIVYNVCNEETEATALATRLIESLSEPFEISGNHVIIGATVGISYAPEDGENADELIRCADIALYEAKLRGRGTYLQFRPNMIEAIAARSNLERELRSAVLRGEFELYFQPIVALHDGSVRCLEALLRWNHPSRGLLSPEHFIECAEATGLILPIGDWVVRQACLQAAMWPSNVSVAINASALQISSSSFVGVVEAAIRESGLLPERLEIEVTETAMLHATDSSVAILHHLQSMGIKIAMDDFGTGYSSMTYLRMFPFDKLKIDKSFIRELGESSECDAIVSASVLLAGKLRMTTVAEGIETEGQLLRAATAGCGEGQGYLFGRPVPASHLDLAGLDADLRQRLA